MRKLVYRAISLAVVVSLGYYVYGEYQDGYFDLPDMPEGSYQINFSENLRGIILDAEVSDPSVGDYPKWMRRLNMANPDRRYLSVPLDVPAWVVGTWSYCTPPTEEERVGITNGMPEELRKNLTGARFDYICRLELDGDEGLSTGLIFSVPQR